MQILRSKHKVRSFAFSSQTKKGVECTCALALHNNTVEVWEVDAAESREVSVVDLPGHRHDVRALCLSSDDTMLLSCSHTAVKVWNPRNGACLRTMESGYGLCCMFVPGNRQCIVGTKSGTIECFDIGSASRYHVEEDAHAGHAVWSLAALKDESGFVSGSADQSVKFWEWELGEDEEGVQRLYIKHTRTLKMAEDVLCVNLNPRGKILATALLDSTIKVFFTDSLKFFLSLYGHKLPVLCMDISSDGSLLASGSADKNIKIWGLDFGDCHKSIFAHNDSVMQVKFVRKTHYLFSVGKDKVVKYWDCDKFEPLLTLEGHKAEVWALTVSHYGDFIVTGSHDRSIRRWERTEEPFFIEEEQERRLESMFEEGIDNAGPQDEVPEEGASGAAGRRNMETLSAADSLSEAMELIEAEAARQRQHEAEHAIGGTGGKTPQPLPPNPLLLGLAPADYLLKAVAAVRTSELEQTLLILPFTAALNLIPFLVQWLQQRKQVERVCQVATLLVRVHQAQLTGTLAARSPLLALQQLLRARLQELKDQVGINTAAIKQLQRSAAERSQF